MKRLHLAALAAIVVAAAPAHAQSAEKLRLFQLPSPDLPRPPNRYSYDPATEQAPPARRDGARMLLGKEVAPDTLLGIGLFHSSPRYRGPAQDKPTFEPRSGRKIGLGLKMRF